MLMLALILAAFVAYFFFDVGREGPAGSETTISTTDTGDGPDVVVGHSNGALGFPAAATRNTTRINGSDPADISVAATLAAFVARTTKRKSAAPRRIR